MHSCLKIGHMCLRRRKISTKSGNVGRHSLSRHQIIHWHKIKNQQSGPPTLKSPWFSNDIRRLVRAINRLFRRAVSSGKENQWRIYCAARNKATAAIRFAKASFLNWQAQILSDPNCPPSKWWSLAKDLCGINGKGQMTVPPLRNSAGKIVTSNGEKANLLNNTYIHKNTCLNSDGFQIGPTNITTSFMIQNFSADDVRKAVQSLPNKTSPGPDQISYRLLKEAGPGVVGPLTSSGSRGGGGGGDAPPPVPAKKKKKKKKKKKSALGFVKSDHRSTMFEGRLNALLRLSVSTRTYTWILKKWWRHTGINIQEECCWVDRWMHDFLHVEHLFFDLPDLPSDFKYFVKIVNICTNYLANSLSDFSEIIPQNSEKCISAHPNFQNFPGEHAPAPPTGGEGRPSP